MLRRVSTHGPPVSLLVGVERVSVADSSVLTLGLFPMVLNLLAFSRFSGFGPKCAEMSGMLKPGLGLKDRHFRFILEGKGEHPGITTFNTFCSTQGYTGGNVSLLISISQCLGS